MNEIYVRDKNLFTRALQELDSAAKQLTQRTYPCPPLPRYKLFKFTKQVSWPYVNNNGKILFRAVYIPGHMQLYLYDSKRLNKVVEQCLRDSERSPAAAQRALHNIQAATAWCRARAKGKERAMQEILRQGKKALDALEAEAALRSLSSNELIVKEKINNIYMRDKHLFTCALQELDSAAKELTLWTYPCPPLPRYKLFKFTKHVSWPRIDNDGKVLFRAVYIQGYVPLYLYESRWLDRVVEQCLRDSERSPAAALRTLRNIQAATAWCRARVEGRERAMQEILRQGQRASDILDAEAALHSLSS